MKGQISRVMIRLYEPEDADLIAWYKKLPDRRRGEIIKNTLRHVLSQPDEKESSQIDGSNLLPEIREIVELTIRGALEEYALPTEKKAIEAEEDVEAENLLNALIQGSKIELEDEKPRSKNTGWGDSW